MFGSTQPSVIFARIITLMIAFTVHELAHALLADRMGDPTPRADGRITLNPLKHLDPFGSLMLLMTGFGWAKPVRIRTDLIENRHKAGVMLISFSGPLSNFLLALVGALLLKNVNVLRLLNISYGALTTFSFFLRQFILINISLAVFNLLPLAPLDGEKVFEFFVPQSIRPIWDRIQAYGMQILLVFFLVLPYLRINIFGKILSPLIFGLYIWMTGA